MAKELIFVLAGESNMAGHGYFNELPDWLKVKPGNVDFYQYGQLAHFSDQPLGRIGPEVAFSKYIAAYYPDRQISIIKYALGSTSLYDWAKNWNPILSRRMTQSLIRNSLYDVVHRQVGWSHVLDKPGSRISAFLWMQGERDAYFSQAENIYYSNLQKLIGDFRKDYHSPHAKFILGRINPPRDEHNHSGKLIMGHVTPQQSTSRPAVKAIRRAQERINRQVRETGIINTDGLAKHDDQVHYNTRGQILLGRLFADEFRRLYGRD